MATVEFREVSNKLNAECRTEQDWWGLAECALSSQDRRFIDGALRKMDSRCAGLLFAINKYNDILAGRTKVGRSTLGLCLLDGVDYHEMMRCRKLDAESRLVEARELRDTFKAML